ncbi:FmdB family zinc ribbon protein [Pseudoclavibacter sp. 13-3]|uniref:FmdB family zinc ribbon protein n=1 Tax=Pseudoclavibacter sp. 13-3 TaxID=2901228 RepID=UPI001E4D0F10|nr:zinc ribbon domain-containing protein [Pseudoclavibacter sp. 13-3]MCD7100754.1 zinc ribbon domain-containing protein [Pseudoclavibacter sp. 13-3]
MILYDFRCTQGHDFESFVDEHTSADPVCPDCGSSGARVLASPLVTGSCGPGPAQAELPQTWLAADRGDRETIDHWRAQAQRRERLEERYPELAGDRRPVLAHEGVFEQRPLRAGEDVAQALREAQDLRREQAERDMFDELND